MYFGKPWVYDNYSFYYQVFNMDLPSGFTLVCHREINVNCERISVKDATRVSDEPRAFQKDVQKWYSRGHGPLARSRRRACERRNDREKRLFFDDFDSVDDRIIVDRDELEIDHAEAIGRDVREGFDQRIFAAFGENIQIFQ